MSFKNLVLVSILLSGCILFNGCGSSGDFDPLLYGGAFQATTVLGGESEASEALAMLLRDEGYQNLGIHNQLLSLPFSVIQMTQDPEKPKAEATTVISAVIPGDHGGEVAVEGTIDLDTFSFLFTMNFENYAPGSAQIFNGIIKMDGAAVFVDGEKPTEITYVFTFTSFTANINGVENLIAGTITVNFDSEVGAIAYIESNLTYTNSENPGNSYLDQTRWTIEIVESSEKAVADVIATVTGRIYNQLRGGYLTVEGIFNCYLDKMDPQLPYPIDGTLTLTGANGGKVLMDYSSDRFSIIIDTDGDGDVDIELGR